MSQPYPPPYRPEQPFGQQPYGQQPFAPQGQPAYGHSGYPAPSQSGPYGPSGYYGPPPFVPQPTNGLATGGFVVALVGAVLALVPFVGIVAWVISPIGLVLSIVGQSVAIRRGGVGRGLANAGIVLGAVGVLICVLWVSALSSASSTSSTDDTTTPTYSAPSSANGQEPAAEPAVPAGSFGQGTYTVGAEIAPGRYRTAGAPAGSLFRYCSASRQTADGTPIGSESTDGGPAFITVRPADGLVEFSGDCVWSPA